MENFYNAFEYTSMPPQKLSSSQKTKKWGEACVNAIATTGNSISGGERSSWFNKKTNYDLVNSVLREEDFKEFLNPYGLEGVEKWDISAKLRSMNLIVDKINLLKGEEINRPFGFQVVGVNGNVVSSREEKKKAVLLNILQNELRTALGQEQQQGPEGEPTRLEEVEKWSQSSLKDIREQWSANILEYLKYKDELDLKFNTGWEHALIAAEEIYYVGVVSGDPTVRPVNVLNCEFHRNYDNPNIEDGDWFKEDRYMTKGQILDEYGEFMTDSQIKQIDEGSVGINNNSGMHPEFAYDEASFEAYGHENYNDNLILVTHVVWKSFTKYGEYRTYDEEGNEVIDLVEDTFKLTPEMKEAGDTIEWHWVSEVWQGDKIGNDIFVNITPIPNQNKSIESLGDSKLPYIGRVYNCTNSKQTSLVDLIKPHQYMYCILWLKVEQEVAKAKGNKLIFDIAQIPKSEGFDMKKWMWHFDNMGIAWINSFEEGKGANAGNTSSFNTHKVMDMAMSQMVVQLIGLMDKTEYLVDKITGISKQREGGTSASETATGVERSVTQSSHITEPWFYIHNIIKRRVLERLIETAKYAWKGKKKLNFIMDDIHRMMVDIDMEMLSDSEYGIFASSNPKDKQSLSKLQSLAEAMISSGTATFTDVIKTFKANSIAELGDQIEKSEAKKQAIDQQNNEMQQKLQEQALAAQAEEKAQDRAFEAQENQLDRENDIQVAALKTLNFDEDVQGTGELEAIESAKMFMEQSKQNAEQSLKSRELDIKEKEIASKERIEKEKNKTALKNLTNAEAARKK